MEQIKSFEDLDVWRVAREIRRDFYQLADRFPKHEQYGLGHQVRTAAVSLTANIAEGYGRFHFKENIQFCRIARGSAYELLDHLIACNDQATWMKVNTKTSGENSFDSFSWSTAISAVSDIRARRKRPTPLRMTIDI
jgi:four helix bundle protein